MAVNKRIKGITIEISADGTKFNEKIKEIEKNITNTKTSLKDVNKLLKLDPKNVELLTQKQKFLNEAVEETREKLKQEQEALKKLEGGEQTKETVAQQEALKREIVETTAELDKLEKEYKEFGSVAKQQTKQAGEEMISAGQKIQQAGQGLTKVGKGLTTYVTAPIVAAGTAVVKQAASFDHSMSKVQAVSGATAEEMDSLRELALKLGGDTKFTIDETAEALTYMGMAGWTAEQMAQGLPGVLSLAAAGDEELATTSDILTDSLTAFNMQVSESTRLADIMATAATKSNTSIGMLGQSFKYAAAPAGALGYSAEDVALALGLMANRGIKADMAGTSLRNMFNRMAKPTKESSMAIERLGLSLYDSQGNMYSFREVMEQMRHGFSNIKMSAEEFDQQVTQLDADLEAGNITQAKYDKALEELTIEAFGAEQAEKARAAAMLGGTRALSGLLAIVGASDEEFYSLAESIDSSSEPMAKLADGSIVPLNEALASGAEIIEEYNGQAEAMAAIMEDNLEGDITKLKSQLSVLAYEFGELLVPELREFVTSLTDLVVQFKAMDDEDKQAIISFAKFAAVIGPVLMVLGGLVTAVGKVVWAIGQIKVALAAGGALEGVGASLAGVGSAISGLIAPIGLVAAAIAVWVHNWDEIVEAGQVFVERTGEHLTEIKERWLEVWDALHIYWSQKWEQIKQTFEVVILAIKTAGALAWEFISNSFNEKVEFIKGVVEGGFGFVKDTIRDKIEGAKENIENTLEAIRLVFETVIELAKNWGKDLIDNFVGGIKSKFGLVKAGMTGLGETIKSYIHFSEPDVGPLSDFNSWMPDMMRQMAEQINEGVPGVAMAMQNAASAMRGEIAPDYSGQLASINNGIGQLAAVGSSNVTVPVYIGQEKLGQAMAKISRTNLYRSGGR